MYVVRLTGGGTLVPDGLTRWDSEWESTFVSCSCHESVVSFNQTHLRFHKRGSKLNGLYLEIDFDLAKLYWTSLLMLGWMRSCRQNRMRNRLLYTTTNTPSFYTINILFRRFPVRDSTTNHHIHHSIYIKGHSVYFIIYALPWRDPLLMVGQYIQHR